MYDRQLKIPSNIRTPAFILDVAALKKNMGLAARVRHEAGITMLLATKSFAMPAAFPFMRDALDGTTASGAFEARLGAEDFGKDVHTYAPAFSDDEFDEVLNFSHTIYFNSPTQLEKFLPRMRAYEKKWGKKICVGVRVNPGYASATVGGDLYNPCAPNSRFGVTRGQLDALPWQDIDTLHVHALCEAQYEGSVGLIRHVAQHFAPYLQRVKAINFGGGHFINHPTYDVAVLMGALKIFKQQFPHLQVVMEPGGGLVVNTGWLATRVLDVHENGQKIMLLDCSPTCHFMDALNGSFRPR
ncbi:MAG: carboxynorspermidine decarboxylase, partial [Alphaproteobacteria bacterium]|nr:carboxynorspermidine decarboxylase [Alphaproteobacteria bacterium]